MKTIEKSFNDCSLIEKLAIQQGIAKAVDAPTAFRVGNALVAEQAKSILQDVVAQDSFLKSIYNHYCKSKTADLNFLKVAPFGTIRPGYGSESTDNRAITNPGNKLTLLGMQSCYFLADDVLQDNYSDPMFTETVDKILINAAAEDLAYLAFNGTTDTPSGTPGTEAYMKTLQTGFPTLFAADTTVNDVTYASTDIIALLKLMRDKMPAKYAKVSDNCFFLSQKDYNTYADQLAALNGSGSAYQSGQPLTYFGIPVEAAPYLENGAIFTSKSNLVVGFNVEGMNLETERRSRKGGYDVIMNYQADFGYFVGEAIVWAS
jgi:hypothetical protein